MAGFRKPSLKRSFSARTTGRYHRAVKRATNPFYGKKGVGFVKNPKRSVHNAVYHRTTFGGLSGIKQSKSSSDTPNFITDPSVPKTSKRSKRWSVICYISAIAIFLFNIYVPIGFLVSVGLSVVSGILFFVGYCLH